MVRRIVVLAIAIVALLSGLFGPAAAEPNKPEGGGPPPKSRIVLHVNAAQISYQFRPSGELRTEVKVWDWPAAELVFTFYLADGSTQTFPHSDGSGQGSWEWCASTAVDNPGCVVNGVDVAFPLQKPFVSMRWDYHSYLAPGLLLRYERDSYGRGKVWVENDSAQRLFREVGSTMVPFEIGELLVVDYRPGGTAVIYLLADPTRQAASVKWQTVQP